MEIRSIEQLQAQVNANQKFNYLFFWGHQQKDNKSTQSCFSQWYEASFEVDGGSKLFILFLSIIESTIFCLFVLFFYFIYNSKQ